MFVRTGSTLIRADLIRTITLFESARDVDWLSTDDDTPVVVICIASDEKDPANMYAIGGKEWIARLARDLHKCGWASDEVRDGIIDHAVK